MPILPPITPSGGLFYISDYENEVILKTENRTSDVERARVWLKDAILELAGNQELRDEFDDLERNGPVYNLTALQQEYDFSNIITTDDYNLATLDLLIWIDYPNNTRRKKLRQTHYQEADKFITSTGGLPTRWYRFADKVGFVNIPDQPYQVQSRYLVMPTIEDAALEATVIPFPRDWHDVLVMCAVERGFIELLEYEKAASIHQLLHGDQKHPERPGLIASRKKRRERENWRDTNALRPVIRGYGWGSKF